MISGSTNPSHHPPWWLADHLCNGHLATRRSHRSCKYILQTDRISHTHFTNKKTVKLPVLSEDSPSLSTPPREQQRVGEGNPCAGLFWTILFPRPDLLLHIRELGGLNQTFPDNQGPDASLYKSVTLLLSSDPYSPYYSEVSCKLWFNNLLGLWADFDSTLLRHIGTLFFMRVKNRLPWHSSH